MNKRIAVIGGVLAVSALTLVGCSGESASTDGESGDVTLSVSGWTLATTPEFQALADGFEELHPEVTVDLKEYDSAEYDTLITADLAAGVGPDIITQKGVAYVSTYQEGGQLMDLSDVEMPEGINGTEAYEIDGSTYGVPYRQDSFLLFYNKDLFDEAGVDYPDGTWTWDDYDEAAAELSEGLDGADGTYLHRWQSTVQGFANSQTPGADILSGDYEYFAPYYERALALQDAGYQADFNTSTANQLTYQGQFGTQQAAMLPMGSWFVATLMSQQAAGEADDFEWGIAPVPQYDSSTTGLGAVPLSFGDPTGFAINANTPDAKVQAAKDFVEYAASEAGAIELAQIGITPALLSEEVVDTYFSVDGVPTDDLSVFAFSTHDTSLENPATSDTAAVQGILYDMHTAIMSGSQSVDAAIAEAESRVANEVDLG
ncbi:ABC transporter substrate-binding protein (plasmid) [Coraliomargarita sp. W4R53]